MRQSEDIRALGEVLDREAGVCCDEKVGCAGIQRLFGCCRILQPIISLTLFVKLSLTAQCSPEYCKSISFKTLFSTKRKLSLCKLKFNRSRCFEAGSTQKHKCSGNSWYGGCGIDLWQLIYGKERPLLYLELRHVSHK
jgi:hypothetical protein